MTGPKKGSRGRGPKKNTAQGRGGTTRDTVRPARERTSRGSEVSTAGEGRAAAATGTRGSGVRGAQIKTSGAGRTSGARSGATVNQARRKAGATPGGERAAGERSGAGTVRPGGAGQRKTPPRVKKALPELKRVQLDAPAPEAVFVDRDGERLTFPDSNLKRVAARILTDKNKAWRYRPFSFPLFTDRGGEQTFHFDFYIYDAEDSVIRLILVVPFESREVWDRVGRFKRQYPMYTYELWTPEKLAQLSGPRGRLGF
ncbi:hypothetical protein [Deinococcus navajonensis]|uniref:Uncharacterized protein n=1 Tax=Deinococcus navajonensis TaxID=309884 RepID=A0ABV8XKD9_9DEIO